jgi:hypothetical protein
VDVVEAMRNATTFIATSTGLNAEIIEAIQTTGEAILQARDAIVQINSKLLSQHSTLVVQVHVAIVALIEVAEVASQCQEKNMVSMIDRTKISGNDQHIIAAKTRMLTVNNLVNRGRTEEAITMVRCAPEVAEAWDAVASTRTGSTARIDMEARVRAISRTSSTKDNPKIMNALSTGLTMIEGIT